MDLYLAIVVIMLVLAVAGLVVGVSNDAVNFLNSALGSKAAPRYVIMTVASVGIIVGAITSSGMMEVARSGVFHPQMFTFAEVMLLFLAVMFTNVILLDLFNTLGMPTSTTVSLVFGLLGAAVGICVFKLSSGSVVTMPDGDPASMADMINTGNAMAIIGGILISVAIAFVCGTVVFPLPEETAYRRRAMVRDRADGHFLFRRLQRAQRHFGHSRACDGVDGTPYAGYAGSYGSRLESADVVAESSENQYTAIDRVGRDLFARACLRG